MKLKLITLSSLSFFVLSMSANAADKVAANSAVKYDRAPASTNGEEIEAVADERAKWHVAQVVDFQEIRVKKFESSVSHVSIYNGGVAMPFEGFITVFDPTPQSGGDFGTFKTFSLGRSGAGLKLIDSKLYQIKADEQVLSLAFTASKWDPNTDKTSVKVLRFRVNIHAGEVSSKASLSIKDK